MNITICTLDIFQLSCLFLKHRHIFIYEILHMNAKISQTLYAITMVYLIYQTLYAITMVSKLFHHRMLHHFI